MDILCFLPSSLVTKSLVKTPMIDRDHRTFSSGCKTLGMRGLARTVDAAAELSALSHAALRALPSMRKNLPSILPSIGQLTLWGSQLWGSQNAQGVARALAGDR